MPAALVVRAVSRRALSHVVSRAGRSPSQRALSVQPSKYLDQQASKDEAFALALQDLKYLEHEELRARFDAYAVDDDAIG
eukprot:5314163-Prymnesium_polylepis.1